MEAEAPLAPASLQFATALEYLGGQSEDGHLCRLHHNAGYLDVWSWLPPRREDSTMMVAGLARTIRITAEPVQYALVDFREFDVPYLSSILNSALCGIEGVVDQTAEMIDALQSEPLRRLVATALLDTEAYRGFWTSPASQRYHHDYPGGLARHSLEVATMVASLASLSIEDREAGVVGALLHDWGKIWCYGAVGATNPGSRHETIGLEVLSGPLQSLAAEDPHTAAVLTELLGGPRAHPEERYPLALRRIVHALDQHSCEQERRLKQEWACF